MGLMIRLSLEIASRSFPGRFVSCGQMGFGAHARSPNGILDIN